MIAVIAAYTGIAPAALLAEPPEMLDALAKAVVERQKTDPGTPGLVPNLEELLSQVEVPT